MTPEAREATNPLAGNPMSTKADLQRAVVSLVEPLLPHQSPGGAQIHLGSAGAHFDPEAVALEGYARPLWGLVPLAAGGGSFDHWDRWREGLVNGTDPDHPEYWGALHAANQREVEMAAIGFGLALAPEQFWDPLDERARGSVVDWLQGINRHEPDPNNHQFFRVMVDLGLRRVGVEFDEGALEQSLDLIETWYVGDGWYRDGFLENYDHYNPIGFHFYGLVFATLANDLDPDRAGRFRERASRFADTYQHWFDARGRVVPYGRSMTYRFSVVSFWAALAYAGVEAVPWPVVKGIVLRHLRWWTRPPIARSDGTLTVGYAYDQGLLAEEYNSPCSPYWALKAFLPLALADDHPFWLADEAGTPQPAPPVPDAIPGYVLAGDATQSVLLNSGRADNLFRQSPAKYGKFAYSSAFGFSVEADVRHIHHLAADSMLAFQEPGSGPLRVRERVADWGLEGTTGWSRWTPWPDVEVLTVLWAGAPWHGRLHRIVTGRTLVATEGGFAIGWRGENASGTGATRTETARRATALTPAGISTIADVEESDRFTGRRGQVIHTAPNTSLLSPRALLPVLVAVLSPGEYRLGCVVGASDDPTAVDPTDPASVPDDVLALFARMG